MTKRVLSLLLALIMALSLCVPAFAADEPEVSADEPATVATDEAAPAVSYELSLGWLKAAVEAADVINANRASYQKTDGTYPLPVGYNFDNATKAAKDLLNEITQADSFDVWMKEHPNDVDEIKTRADALIAECNVITDVINKDQADWLDRAIEQMGDIVGTTDATKKTQDMTYQPEYLVEARALLADMEALAEEDAPSFLAFKALVERYWGAYKYNVGDKHPEGWIEGAGLGLNKGSIKETQALEAEFGDTTRLHLALEAAKKAYDEALDKTDKSKAELKKWIDSTEGMFDAANTVNGLASWVKLLNLNTRISELEAAVKALEDQTKNVYIVRYSQLDTQVVGIIACRNDTGKDNHEYTVKYSINGGAEKIAYLANDDKLENRPKDYFGTDGVAVVVKPEGTNKNTFAKGTTVTITIYDEQDRVVDTVTVTITDYQGAVFAASGYEIDRDAAVAIEQRYGFNDLNVIGGEDIWYFMLNHRLDYAGWTFSDYKFELVDPAGKVNQTLVPEENIVGAFWNVNGDESPAGFAVKGFKAVVGAWTVKMYVGSDLTGWKQVDSTAINIPDITTYASDTPTTAHPYGTKGYDNLQAAVEDCKDVDGLVAIAGKQTANVKAALADLVASAEAYMAKASTTVNDKDNRQEVDLLIALLTSARAQLMQPGKYPELEKAVADAEALVPSDYTNYNTIADDISTAVKEGKKMLDEKNVEAKVAKAKADEINGYIAKLNVKVPDFTVLQELVDSVPSRLNADDFSSASRAAVLAAVAEAQSVLDLKNKAKQSEVDSAAAKLQDALNSLTTVKSDAAPAGPDNGGTTGWATAENGDYYYYDGGKLVINKWVKSNGLWYHMGATGKMDTGFLFIDDEYGGGWYYLNPSNAKGTMGRMFTGWKMIDGHWAWFETRSNGHQGQCTYTDYQGDYVNYRPVK